VIGGNVVSEKKAGHSPIMHSERRLRNMADAISGIGGQGGQGGGDWQMNVNRKSGQLEAENAQYLEQMSQQRETQQAQQAEQQKQIDQAMAEQQSKTTSAQGMQALGG